MARLRVHNFTISLDGYAAGPDQQVEHPLGHGGMQLHEWIFQTASMRALLGKQGGEIGLNDELFRARAENVGATIMGRNMFVLTHHQRPDLIMWNGTVFHFVDTAPADVLALAAEAAEGRDVVLGGGPATVRAFLAAGLIDELHGVIAPILLGTGERLFDATLPMAPDLQCSALRCGTGVAHARLIRTGPSGSGIISD
ncbi:MAG: dihydrofolate reductase family protein [Acidimicrobiales bacterium]